MASRSNRSDFNRRELLGLIGMGGAVGIAGCIGDDDDDADPDTPTPTATPPDDATPTPPPADAQQMVHTVSDGENILTVDTAADAVADGVWGMKFEFDLHEGVHFHSGEEMTAHDFVATFDRYQFSMMEAQTFDDVMYYEADGDYQLNVYLPFPDPEGIRNANITLIPEAQAVLDPAAIDPREGTTPGGTGPYVFDEFEDAQYYVVQKNDNYWLDDLGLDALEWYDGPGDFPTSPLIETVDMDLIPSDSTRQAALLNDEVDITYGLSADDLTEFDQSDDFVVEHTQTGGYDFLQFPIQHEPWDDERLRQAVNHLIPREVIAEQIFAGWRDEAWIPLPNLAQAAGTADAVELENLIRPRNEYDPEAADEILEELEAEGVEFPIQVQLETNADNDDRVATNELIAESMNASGWFDVNLELFEWGAFLGRILVPDYWERGHMMYVGLSGTFNPDSFVGANHHSRNVGQCCNANYTSWDDFDDMIDDAALEMDFETRQDKYDDIWDVLTQRHGTVYTVIGLTEAVMHNRVQGFDAYPFPEGLFSYALHSPTTQVYTEVDGSDTLRLAVAENIASFDPPYSNDTTSSLGQSFLYESLTTSAPDGEVFPWLASGWEMEFEEREVADYADYMIPIEEAEGGN